MSASVLPMPQRLENLPPGIDPHSDLANAYRLVQTYGQDIRHCAEMGWLSWNDRVWEVDEPAIVRRMIAVVSNLRRAAAQRLADAASRSDQDAAEHDLKHARKSQSEPAIRRAMELARNLSPIATKAEAFDGRPMLFVAKNGTVDLTTGELGPHDRSHLLTQASKVAYDPAAQAPTWERFLETIQPDPEVRAFLQRFLGYSATGSTREQCFAITWGSGANGKSTLEEAAKHVLGAYATEAAADTFLTSSRGRGPDNKLAALRASRMVTTSESGEDRRLDEALVKRVTGGDQLTANFLYREMFTYYPQFKLWMATNHRPEIRGVDHGIWRRIRLVPFTVTIPPEEQDHELSAKLREEAPGILAWIVRGAVEWFNGGLQAPQAVMAATEEWKAEANDVGTFIAERCVALPQARTKTGALYEAYREWARDQGMETLNATAFGRRVQALGFSTDNSRKYRIGIGLEAQND